MSEKQRFNKDMQNRQIVEKRRERWMSRKILTEILEDIRLQKNDANWILYQIFTKETLSYKSKIKIWNHLMQAGYDLSEEKPEKPKETTCKLADIRTIHLIQKTAEENYKLNRQLNEANEVIKQIAENWTGLAGRQWHPAFGYLNKYNINYEAIK